MTSFVNQQAVQMNGEITSQNPMALPAPSSSTGSVMTMVSNPPVSNNFSFPTQHSRLPQVPLSNRLQAPIQIYNIPINTTSITTSPVSLGDPFKEYLQEPTVTPKLENYKFLRGTLELIFQLTVPAGSFGHYVISCVPRAKMEFNYSASLEYPNATQVDNFLHLDVSSTTEAVMQVPCYYNQMYVPISELLAAGDPLICELYITAHQVIAQGTTSSGAVGGRLMILAHFLDDIELCTPIYQGKKDLKMIASDAAKKYAPKTHKRIMDAHETMKEVQPSGVLYNLSSAAHAVSKVPVLSAFAAPAAAALDTMGSIFEMFGYTKERDDAPITKVQNRAYPTLAVCDGDLNLETCSLMNANSIDLAPALLYQNDEDILSYAYLFAKPTLVAKIPWSGTDAVGDILKGIAVSPFYSMTKDNLYYKPHFTVAGYVGLPFAFWFGTMKYEIHIPVSIVHRGSIQVSWLGTASAPPDGSQLTNVTYNTIISVNPSKVVKLSVGMQSDHPLPTTIINDALPIVPIGAGNGILVFSVVTPLVGPTDTISTNILVYASCDGDMGFFRARDTIRYPDPTNGNAITNLSIPGQLSYQGKALGDGPVEEEELVLVPGIQVPVDRIFYGENIRSCRALLQKLCRLRSIETNDTYYPTLGLGPLDPNQVWTLQSHIRNLYIGMATSERFVVTCDGSGYVVASRVLPVIDSLGGNSIQSNSWTRLDATMQKITNNNSHTFSVPYYGNTLMASTHRSGYNPGAIDLVSESGTLIQVSSSAATYYMTYYAYGEDIRVGPFYQVPVVVLYPKGNTATPLFPE
nr:MAG: capsid protein [Chemarfal virus 129]